MTSRENTDPAVIPSCVNPDTSSKDPDTVVFTTTKGHVSSPVSRQVSGTPHAYTLLETENTPESRTSRHTGAHSALLTEL